MISQEQADRIETTLAKVLELLEERAKMLPRMPSVPASEATYKPAPLPTATTFSVEEAVGAEAEIMASGDELVKRAVAARLNAPPSQADMWTVLIQFFPFLKTYVNHKVQDFGNQVRGIFHEEKERDED